MNTDFNEPAEFKKLSKYEQTVLLSWIKNNILPKKTANYNYSSYGLKHLFENASGGFYITNGMFKGGMLAGGYVSVDVSELNWYFRISQKFPALKNRKV